MRVNFWIASVLCAVALGFAALIQRGFRGWGAEPAGPAPPGTRYGPNAKRRPEILRGPGASAAPAEAAPATTAEAATGPGSRSARSTAAPARRPPPPPPRKRNRRAR